MVGWVPKNIKDFQGGHLRLTLGGGRRVLKNVDTRDFAKNTVNESTTSQLKLRDVVTF